MLQAGNYYDLKVVKLVDFGVYLDANGDEVLLPKRYVPAGTKEEDEIRVFLYHDSESRVIATTEEAKGVVGDIVSLKVVSTTPHGAFLDWGINKDIFLPLSQMVSNDMYPGEYYPVYIFIDEQTGRVAATERIERFLSNDELTVKELELVSLLIYRGTDIGYEVIINSKHKGLLHFNEVYRDLSLGDTVQGFIKKIRTDNKIDVVLGRPGYERVSGEEEKILQLLQENDGYLPYHDKSDPEEIYSVFGMSKKTFKMAVGALYKKKRISLAKTGIKLED